MIWPVKALWRDISGCKTSLSGFLKDQLLSAYDIFLQKCLKPYTVRDRLFMTTGSGYCKVSKQRAYWKLHKNDPEKLWEKLLQNFEPYNTYMYHKWMTVCNCKLHSPSRQKGCWEWDCQRRIHWRSELPAGWAYSRTCPPGQNFHFFAQFL